MSAIRVYRVVLRLLPAELRRKHGEDMEALFARNLEQARERGPLHGALAIVMAVWDVLSRTMYEKARDVHVELEHRPLSRARLLSQFAYAFATSFAAFTAMLLFLFTRNRWSSLSAPDATFTSISQTLLFALPFITSMSIPIAVLFAVLQVFTRLGANGTLSHARRAHHGVRRLVVPVLAAATTVSALAFVVTAEIVPRANVRLTEVMTGGSVAPNDRMMTISELQSAVRNVGVGSETAVRTRVATLEVEIQKKLALPAACVVLALFGMAIAFRLPRGGAWLLVVASVTAIGAYYMMLMTGEALADQLVVSPAVGMWGANAVTLLLALLLAISRGNSMHPDESAYPATRSLV